MDTQEKTNAEKFGQVFTSKKVARLMVQMLRTTTNPTSNYLDPCLGKNIFFEELERYNAGNLTGIEIDDTLIDKKITDFYAGQNRNLIIGDFFDLPLTSTFDAIILNPPYLRQELLNSEINGKNKITRFVEGCGIDVSKKSNLYIYFLIKCLKHLKENGTLIAIVYDSWLFTDYGKILKQIIEKNYSLIKVVHFRHSAFENVNVGATIILLKNAKTQPPVEYYSYASSSELSEEPQLDNAKLQKVKLEELFNIYKLNHGVVDFDTNVFIQLQDISSQPITRGVAAIVNKYFIFTDDRFPPYTKKIIKDISIIRNFEVNTDFNYLLEIPTGPITDALVNYLSKIKSEVTQNPNQHKNLFNRIMKYPIWYKINGKKGGNVIFNYYYRTNTHFIYNPTNYIVADNFYNLSIDQNIPQNFSILNSTLTRYALFKYGRSQGRGLFKIQLTQFKSIPVLDVKLLDKMTRDKLECLGKLLMKSDRKKSDHIIAEIDETIIQFLNRSLNINLTVAKLFDALSRLKDDENG